ncbi:MAG: hypothetical protein CBR30_00520 [Dictyoglomus sp. NZ13-RE01]|nr:MAG: hypothetical protein CBR30_00520 [Dictyoglomus sp. NZ13-RE01]
MIAFLKVSIIFGLIVSAIFNKVPLAWALLGGSIILGVSFGIPFIEILKTALNSTIAWNTINIVLILYLIAVLENILRNKNFLKNMVTSLKNLVKNPKINLMSMPIIMGLLPSVGGALFSAPLLEEMSEGNDISAEKKAFINYWFRHVWEPFLPLYPGIILVSSLSDFKIPILVRETFIFGIIVFVIGFILAFYKLQLTKEEIHECDCKKEFINFLINFSPFIFILLLVLAFHIDLLHVLLITIIALFLIFRYSLDEIKNTLKDALKIENLILIVSVMIFKGMLEKANAISDISYFLSSMNIPLSIIFFTLPFIVGLLTGVTQASIGITFPILLSLMPYGQTLKWVVFSFISGYTGVMMSPTHLCLIFTKEYFKTDWNKLYPEVIKAGVILIIFNFLKTIF